MLIGRDVELGRITSGLADARLVTLTGPGGVGKTVLARAAAAAWPPDGVLFAELADFDDDDLDERIAGSLGFASFADLAADAASRPWLLVLDNCERVVDTAAAVATRLLDAGRGLRILATSRERLDLPGELCVRVDPLPTDGSPSPAAQLFREVAEQRGAFLADDPAAIDELCRRLDGLPLALELAAARAATMTAAEMLSHLDARLDLLARSRPRGPARHRSLGAAVEWSYQQLDDGERATFERLAVFAAPFTADMAAAAAELLARPGQEIAALDLMDAGVVGGDAGPASDAAARRRYQERIRNLQARADAGDQGAKEELDALIDHLTAAYGLRGRDRTQGQPAEKARSAVTWRIRTAIKRIAEAHPALADHLDRSVRTGRFCVYDPAEPVDWEF